MSHIFIDGSYFCFHRFFSVSRWLKLAHPEDAAIPPISNPRFIERFRKTFVDTIRNLSQSLRLPNLAPTIVVGRDCPKSQIWRHALQQNYKSTRKTGGEDDLKMFIKMAYDELFLEAGVATVLFHPRLEADDCIALAVKRLLSEDPATSVTIITSDKDYLQLAGPRVQIFDLFFKNIADKKSSTGDAKADLFCKIVMGDTSDNIPSVLNKCGPKTALKCYNDRTYFDSRMQSENAFAKFELNQKMVDFDFIPAELVAEFFDSYETLT
jgi:5'-3' exonuclease